MRPMSVSSTRQMYCLPSRHITEQKLPTAGASSGWTKPVFSRGEGGDGSSCGDGGNGSSGGDGSSHGDDGDGSSCGDGGDGSSRGGSCDMGSTGKM